MCITRDEQIKKLRPIINTIDMKLVKSEGEKFQNDVLRPVIKFQHDLLLTIFNGYVEQYKIELASLTQEKRIAKIELLFQKDRNLTNELRGVIVGLFAVAEYKLYATMKSEINKRLIQIIKERIISTMV